MSIVKPDSLIFPTIEHTAVQYIATHHASKTAARNDQADQVKGNKKEPQEGRDCGRKCYYTRCAEMPSLCTVVFRVFGFCSPRQTARF